MQAESIRRDLASALGDENVLTGPLAAPFVTDAFSGPRGKAIVAPAPLDQVVVARPATTDEVVAVVQTAAEHSVPVVPHGGGSGLMGAAVPVQPSIVIDTGRLTRILHVDPAAQAVRVQAGAVIGDLNRALEPHGLFCGHDPWTVNVATVGGTVSTDSLGYLGAKYGSMGDQVLELEVVLADGTMMTAGAPAKASAGPDLRRVFIGGEGCFGVITEALLRVFPVPEERTFRAFEFASFAEALQACLALRASGVSPGVLDLSEEFAAGEPAPARLILGFEGFRAEVQAIVSRAHGVCRKVGGRPLPDSTGREYWARRHDIGDRFAARRQAQPGAVPAAPAASGFDYAHVTLPTAHILSFREGALGILREARVHPSEFGSWCWPELVSVYAWYDDGPEGRARLTAAMDEVMKLAQDLGGSMEYCHGAGLRLAHLMPREPGNRLGALRAIKRALDPNNLMNPGKLGL